MVEVTVTFSDEDFAQLKTFADEKGITLSELVRRTILDWLDDEEDIRDAEAAYQEYLKNPESFRNFKEPESKWLETNLAGCENPRLHGNPLRGEIHSRSS